MVIAGLYYLMSIGMITSGFGLMLFSLALPFVIFNFIAIFKNKKRGLGIKIPVISFGIALIAMITGGNLVPPSSNNGVQASVKQAEPVSEAKKENTDNGKLVTSSTALPSQEPKQAQVLLESSKEATQQSSRVKAVVVKVVDGDTFEIESGKRVRLIGIDTAESVHPDQSRNTEFGKTASAYTKSMLEGKVVYLEKDVSETDKYGRLLRYVYLENGTFYNELLVKEGMAKPATFPPDVKYADVFVKAQQYARENNIGLWAIDTNKTVQNTPTPYQPQPTQTPYTSNNQTNNNVKQYVGANGKGLIKGNINSKKERIYHIPGGQYYDKTIAEEWFETEQDARNAGYRPSKR